MVKPPSVGLGRTLRIRSGFGYLGGIREAFIDEREREHRAFWRGVDAHLDELGLDPDTCARVEASVESRVRRVTPENQAEFDAAQVRLKREVEARIAGL